jgi:hypothetical protein
MVLEDGKRGKRRRYRVNSLQIEEKRRNGVLVWQRHSFPTGHSSSDKPTASAELKPLSIRFFLEVFL